MGDYSQSSLFTDSPLVSMQRYQISGCNSNLHNTYNSVVRTPVPVVSLMGGRGAFENKFYNN